MTNKQDGWRTRIGMLRQWLNEDKIKDAKNFVTNEDLEHWLEYKEEIEQAQIEMLVMIYAYHDRDDLGEMILKKINELKNGEL